QRVGALLDPHRRLGHVPTRGAQQGVLVVDVRGEAAARGGAHQEDAHPSALATPWRPARRRRSILRVVSGSAAAISAAASSPATRPHSAPSSTVRSSPASLVTNRRASRRPGTPPPSTASGTMIA